VRGAVGRRADGDLVVGRLTGPAVAADLDEQPQQRGPTVEQRVDLADLDDGSIDG
jgi:hypothetical protein